MRHQFVWFATTLVLTATLGARAHAEDVSAKKMQIKDNADAGRQRLTFLSTDTGIAAADGYTGATGTGLSLHAFSQATTNDICIQVGAGDCELRGANADILKCRTADRTANILVKPGRAKAKFKDGVGFELNALENQLPVVMVLRVGAATYCAVCGDGGSDEVVKDGSDGTQVLAKTCDAVACPTEPGACGLPGARPEDPVVLTGATVGAPVLGVLPPDVVAFRWAAGWQQIPVQVDERAMVNFDTVYNGMGGGPWCGTTCGGGYTRLDYTDTGTFTGADADPMFDADDEVVFMASDAGGPAETTTEPPGTLTGSGVEVVLTDPLAPGSWYVYLFRGDGSLGQGAGQQYVNYQFSLSSGPYLTTYQLLNGPNPENTTVSTAAYSRHFSDRWTQDQLRIFTGAATGVDILERHNEDVFTCSRTEDTFNDDEGAFVVNRGGPVRALRSYVGANSGPRTQRQHIFYRGREDNTTFLRVHAIPPVYDFIDHEAAAVGMKYYDNNNTAGLTIDGLPDGFTAGVVDWQLVTGAQGSVTVVPQFSTDISGFLATSTYEDNSTQSSMQCTGDDVPAYGANGVKIEDSTGGIPNTDPVVVGYATMTAIRLIYYDAPGLSVADAQQRLAWALNPLGVARSAWP